MKSAYTSKLITLALMLVLAAATTFPAFAEATTFSDSWTEPYVATLVACNGEEVFLSGEIHISYHTTMDANGGSHTLFAIVPKHVVGVGSVTGTHYRAVGGAREQYVFDTNGSQEIYTNINIFNLISQGSSDNLQAKYIFHVTVNANGEITVFVENTTSVCVG